MKPRKLLSVVGARPNFIKIAPLDKALSTEQKYFTHRICHTGQHFDANMSEIFFTQLGMPEPDYNLGIGGGSHTEQTARIMRGLEEVMNKEIPDMLIVPGDVNSTMAGALTAVKMGIPVAHVESGLRSFDRRMPEEINRVVTDVVSDLLFVSEPSGLKNLKHEGVDEKKIFFVGNIMIDSLVRFLPVIRSSGIFGNLGVRENDYILVTFHRPSNVDSAEKLAELTGLLNQLSEKKKVIFPIHPRTRKNLEKAGLLKNFSDRIIHTDPIGYIDFLALVDKAALVITDSGGIQEETTFLGVQCLTVRDNTERPVTVEKGTNQLIGTDLGRVYEAAGRVLDGAGKKGNIPELWDGHTAERIVEILKKKLF